MNKPMPRLAQVASAEEVAILVLKVIFGTMNSQKNFYNLWS